MFDRSISYFSFEKRKRKKKKYYCSETTLLSARSLELATASSYHESRSGFSNICALRFALSVQSLYTSTSTWLNTPAATISCWVSSDTEQSDSSAPAAYSVAWWYPNLYSERLNVWDWVSFTRGPIFWIEINLFLTQVRKVTIGHVKEKLN